MTDEALKQEKYRCEIQSGLEGLEIADLFIKFGVLQKHVVLQQGEYLPADLVEFDNLKKSRLAGALKRCIEHKWISVENPAEPIPAKEVKVVPLAKLVKPAGVTEVEAGIISASEVTSRISDMRRVEAADMFPQEKPLPVKEIISSEQSRATNTFAITETAATVAAQDPYVNFDKLRYFQKLKTIKDATDVVLLKAIVGKSEYPQLVHNAQVRIQELAKQLAH